MEYRSTHDAKRAYASLKDRGVDFDHLDGFIPSMQNLLAKIYVESQDNPAKEEIPTTTESNDGTPGTQAPRTRKKRTSRKL